MAGIDDYDAHEDAQAQAERSHAARCEAWDAIPVDEIR